jgi:hypothetical protein
MECIEYVFMSRLVKKEIPPSKKTDCVWRLRLGKVGQLRIPQKLAIQETYNSIVSK